MRISAAGPPGDSIPSDDFWPPANTAEHTEPLMGDSVGSLIPGRSVGGTGTLGPLLQTLEGPCWLVSHSICDGCCEKEIDGGHPDMELTQPGQVDHRGHRPRTIGHFVACSGSPKFETVVESQSLIRCFDSQLPTRAYTDWALFKSKSGRIKPNQMRYSPEGRELEGST